MKIKPSSQKIGSLEELAAFCSTFSLQIVPGITIGFFGELGAGKTTFIRYLCQALKVAEPVSSPSYVLEHRYLAPDGVTIEHWDLYRTKVVPDELFEPPHKDTLRLIEWAERLTPEIGLDCSLKLILEADGSRILSVSCPAP